MKMRRRRIHYVTSARRAWGTRLGSARRIYYTHMDGTPAGHEYGRAPLWTGELIPIPRRKLPDGTTRRVFARNRGGSLFVLYWAHRK